MKTVTFNRVDSQLICGKVYPFEEFRSGEGSKATRVPPRKKGLVVRGVINQQVISEGRLGINGTLLRSPKDIFTSDGGLGAR